MNRRRFLKYAGATVVASAAAVSSYYLLPKLNEVTTIQQTTLTNTTAAQTITSEGLHNINPYFDIGAAAGNVVNPLTGVANYTSKLYSQFVDWRKKYPIGATTDMLIALGNDQLPIISALKEASGKALQETVQNSTRNLYSAFYDVKNQFQDVQNAAAADINKKLDDWNKNHAADNPNDAAGKGTYFSDIERQMKDNANKFNKSSQLQDLLQILSTNEAGLGYVERTSSAISSIGLIADSMINNEKALEQNAHFGMRIAYTPGGYAYQFGLLAMQDISSDLQTILTGGTGLTYSTTPIQGMEKWRRVHPLYKPTFNKILDELGKIDKDAPAKIKGFVDNDESPYTLYPMLNILSNYKEKPGYEGKAAQVISNGLTTGDINNLGSLLKFLNPFVPPFDDVNNGLEDLFYFKNATLLPDDHLEMSTKEVGESVMNKMHKIFAQNEKDVTKTSTIAAWNGPSSMSSGLYDLIFQKTMQLGGRQVFGAIFYFNEMVGGAGGAGISVAPVENEFYVFYPYRNTVVKPNGFDDYIKNYDIAGYKNPLGAVQIFEPFRDGAITPATYSSKGILNSLPSPAGYPTS